MNKHIWARVQLMIIKGALTLINGSKAQAKGLEDEVLNNIQLITPAGFAHAPTNGSQAVMVFPAGDRSFGIAVVVGDTRYTLELAAGGVGLHDPSGSFVRLNNDGGITLKPSGGMVKVEGDLHATGEITQGG